MSCPLKDNEVNRTTSILHFITLLITGTAMVQTGWFRIRGGHCSPHLGLTPFFGQADYHSQVEFHSQPSIVERRIRFGDMNQVLDPTVTAAYNYHSNEVFGVRCVFPRSANMMRVIIFLCCDIMIFCLLGIILNFSNMKNDYVKAIQRNGIMSIMTFVTVIMVIGMSYYVTVVLEEDFLYNVGVGEISVSYEFGFYVIVVAGVVSIFNAAISLLFGSVNDMMIIVQRPLIDDWDGAETFNIDPTPSVHRTLSSPSCAPFHANSRIIRQTRILPPAPEAVVVGDNLAMLPPPPPYTP